MPRGNGEATASYAKSTPIVMLRDPVRLAKPKASARSTTPAVSSQPV
jgi:hypothetical protein